MTPNGLFLRAFASSFSYQGATVVDIFYKCDGKRQSGTQSKLLGS